MRYIYISQFHDNCGYAAAARGYLKAFDAVNAEIELNIYSVSLETDLAKLEKDDLRLLEKYELTEDDVDAFIDSDEFVVIWHMPPPMITMDISAKLEAARKLISQSKDNINITTWEASRVPPGWAKLYRMLGTENIIVPSSWNKEIFKTVCENVHLLPHVIGSHFSEPKPMNIPVDFKNDFVIFSMSQWDIRKGFDLLIRSVCMEFGDQEDISLVIKTYGNIMDSSVGLQQEQAKQINSEVDFYKRSVILDSGANSKCKIVMLHGVLPYENITWLYQQCDLFALLTRGEGFGLTISEATEFGSPVLVPDQGGHTDYLEDYDNKYFVSGRWTPYHSKPGYSCNMNWYESNILDARKQLRRAYNDWHDKKLTKTLNSPEAFSLNSVGKGFIDILMNLENSIANESSKVTLDGYSKLEVARAAQCTAPEGVFTVYLNEEETGVYKKFSGQSAHARRIGSPLKYEKELRAYKDILSNLESTPVLGQYMMNAHDIEKDGSYKSKYVDGYDLHRLEETKSKIIIQKIMCSIEQLKNDLSEYSANHRLFGDWQVHNLVYETKTDKIYNVDLEGFYTYPRIINNENCDIVHITGVYNDYLKELSKWV